MDGDSTLNDKAWRKVINGTSILKDVRTLGCAHIKASTLEQIGMRQPRLMAKLDSSSDRPTVFEEHSLNILPDGRGTYVIFEDSKNSCYFNLPARGPARQVTKYLPSANFVRLDTLTQGVCSTECQAVELAYLSSMLNTFCGVENLVLTRRGRFASGAFEIKLPGRDTRIPVNNAQIEVDSIYETNDAVVLLEAKIGFRDNFHLRQLHYPYMWLLGETSKRIIPVLLCYSNGEFQLTEFRFGKDFGDFEIVQQNYFIIDEEQIAVLDLDLLLRFLPSDSENDDIPFPQADDFEKVIDILSVLKSGISEPEELSDVYGFVTRQVDYYLNAARYLALVDDDANLTTTGLRLLNQRHRVNRTELLLKCMLARPVLRECIIALKEHNFQLSALKGGTIESMIADSRRKKLADKTLSRRAVTVRSWLNWLLANCNFAR